MSASPSAGAAVRRPVPAHPSRLLFTYVLDEPVSLTKPAPYRHLERWVVSVAIDDPVHDEHGRTIGDAHVIILNLEPGRDVRDFADVVSGQWHEAPGTVVEGGSAPTHLLVLDRVWVNADYRGNGLGPVIAAVVIDRLGRGCRLAACFPAPLDGDRRPEDREREVEALGRVWAKVGFRPWQDGVWMLDLDEHTARDALVGLLPS